MDSRETMIQIENVSKVYRLGEIGGTTLTDTLKRFCAKLLKKEDPTKKIGTKNYNKGDKFLALDGISLTIKKGERVGIIGHNGAGKSTLLKMICRVTTPTTGEIGLNGRITSMLEVGTGFHGELTGRENIYMNGAILGMTKKEIDSKIETIIDFSEVRQFIDTPVKRYSSGMYVKLAFAVAAHLDSDIMIMDEVLAVGDMAFQNKCLEKMKNVADNDGRTILYVSHNLNTVRKLCDRVIILKKGKIVFDGNVNKGIAFYLGVDNPIFPVFHNLFDAERPTNNHGSRLRAKSLTFNKSINAFYEQREPILFHMDIESSSMFKHILLLVTIKNNEQMVVGSAQTNFEGFFIKKGSNEIHFSFKHNCITPGDYFIELDLFQLNEFNDYLSLDHPLYIVPFRVLESSRYNGLKWNNSYYGNIAFDNIEIVNK